MDIRALTSPAPPHAARPHAGRPSRRRRAVGIGTGLLLAAALVWPTAAQAAVPADPAAAEHAGALSGRVSDSTGAPVEGVRVLVDGSAAGTETAPDGTWALDGLGEGPVFVRFVARDAGGQEVTLSWDGTPYGTYGWGQDASQAPDPAGVDLTLVDNVASGTVTADGEPVTGATVGLYRWSSDAEPVRTVTTAADGTWSAGWLRPGSYAVLVTPPDGSGLARAWWNTSGTTYGTVFFDGTARAYPGVDVDLAAESQLTGRLVDEGGQPVAGAPVALWTSNVLPVRSLETVTAADGTYTFRGLAAGSYTVEVARPAVGQAGRDSVMSSFLGGALDVGQAVWTTVGPQDEVAVDDLVRRLGGTISGTVTGEGGWDGPGLAVEFLAADGSVAGWSLARDAADGPDFASDGALPAGRYRVRATISGGEYWWAGGNSFETARVLDVRAGVPVTDVELVIADEHVEAPAALTEALTEDNRGGLGVAGPVVAGGTVAITGLSDGLRYVWLAPSEGLGFGRVVDGTLQVTFPATTAAGAHRLAVTTAGGYLLGWTDVTVLAAGGVSPAVPPVAAPGAAATPVAAVVGDVAGARSTGARSGALAATGSDIAWVVGSALGAAALGAGLVVLRRRRPA